MPIDPPWLSSLPRASRLAYPAVQSAVARGLSANKTAALLSDAGIPIRRQTLLDLFRLEKGVQASGSLFRHLPPDFTPDPQRLPVSLHPLSDNFSYTVRVTGLLGATGQVSSGFVTVTSSESLSRQEIEDAAEEAATQDGTAYSMEVTDLEVVRGIRSSSLL